MDAKIDILRVKDTNGSEYAVYPKTLIKCVTNENGDNLEDTLKEFIKDNASEIVGDEVASKTYVAEQIAGASHLTREIVTEIPTVETAKDNVIYMYKVESASGNDMYQEYQLINGEVVMVGDTSVDLSGYAKSEELDNYFKNTGGNISGNVNIISDIAEEKALRVSNSNGTMDLVVASDGAMGLIDRNDQWILRKGINEAPVLYGTANEAIKSTFDGNGNNIAETYATTADLTNYFPKSGNDTIHGNVVVKNDNSGMTVLELQNDTGEMTGRFVANGTQVGMTNETAGKWVFTSTTDGTTTFNGTAVNSTQLDGKDASEYMEVAKYQPNTKTFLKTSILEKALELETNGVYDFILSGSSYSGGDLPNVNYAFSPATVLKRGTGINVILWGITLSGGNYPPVMNFYNDTKWMGWKTLATTADLANYLPLSGGTLSNASVEPLIINRLAGANSFLGFQGNGAQFGGIGFVGVDHLVRRSADGTVMKRILDEGNKPIGTYVGNGSDETRTIATGGIGASVVIWAVTSVGNSSIFVNQGGYGHRAGVAFTYSSAMASVNDGIIILATDDINLNESGTTYHYQVL